MSPSILRVLLCVLSVICAVNAQQNSTASARAGKFLFGAFNLVRFVNDKCTNTVGESGTCLTKFECLQRAGSASGLCAAGFGVCCISKAGCGDVITQNNTYITSPSSLGTASGNCMVTIRNTFRSVCQVRFDLEQLNLAGPDNLGVCNSDTFNIIGATNQIPTICGTNDNQHVYAHIGYDPRDITLRIRGTGNFATRNFKILVSFIPCDCGIHAPEGCLQYYTGLTVDNIRSFNWKISKQGQHLANQDYEICFRTEYDQCGLCLAQCFPDVASGSFSIEGSNDLHINSYTAFNALQTTQPCSSDYVFIECGQRRGTDFRSCLADRYCGALLSPRRGNNVNPNVHEQVCTYRQPLRIRFKTDAIEMTPNPIQAGSIPDTQGGGFCLKAEQLNCYSK